MRIQKFGHSCLLVEDSGARALIDPGSFSNGFEGLRDLDALLITHVHPDHLDLDRVGGLLEANPGAVVVSDVDSVEALAGKGITSRGVDDGETVQVGGLTIEVIGSLHAVIHPDIPRARNVGFLIGGRLFHPGDAFTVPDRETELLAIPATAPWLKLAEAIDYLRAVAPRVAIPIHERVWTFPAMAYDRLRDLGPAGTQVLVIDDGEPVEL